MCSNLYNINLFSEAVWSGLALWNKKQINSSHKTASFFVWKIVIDEKTHRTNLRENVYVRKKGDTTIGSLAENCYIQSTQKCCGWTSHLSKKCNLLNAKFPFSGFSAETSDGLATKLSTCHNPRDPIVTLMGVPKHRKVKINTSIIQVTLYTTSSLY